MSDRSRSWICCQLGAREHYAIPRALHLESRLSALLTDAWVRPKSVWAHSNALKGRFDSALASAPVHAFTGRLLALEGGLRLKGVRGWAQVLARNRWFQDRCVARLSGLVSESKKNRQILFSYSYTALKPFRFAKASGWTTVLGQIDPGPYEEEIVRELYAKYAGIVPAPDPVPSGYWDDWREETALADIIIVNSDWSAQGLRRAGVPARKIVTIPLAYDSAGSASLAPRSYPPTFSHDRPLRVLFLGQVGLRKGAAELAEAARMLEGQPVEFSVVGPADAAVNGLFAGCANVRLRGRVSRLEAAGHYRAADVFILPTHSDGFALTQLEAQAHRLPLIVSDRCGAVVRDGENGTVLREISGKAVADALRSYLLNPSRLKAQSDRSVLPSGSGISRLGRQLIGACDAHT